MVLRALRQRFAHTLLVARAFPAACARNLGYSIVLGAAAGYVFVLMNDGVPLFATCLVGMLLAAIRYVWRMGAAAAVLPGPLRDLVPESYSAGGVTIRQVGRVDRAAVVGTIDQVVVTTMGWRDADIAHIAEAARSRRAALRAGLLVVCCPGTDDIAGVVMVAPDVATDTLQLGLWLGPDHRGRGLGRAAIGASADIARLLGFDELLLETAATNGAMRRAIEASGGVLRSERPHPLPNGRTDPGCRYVIRRVADRT